MKGKRTSLLVTAAMLAIMSGISMDAKKATMWIKQGFEKINIVKGVHWYGNPRSDTGRWGPFHTSDLISSKQAHSGSKSLQTKRRHGPIIVRTELGKFGSGTGSKKRFELSFWIYREPGAENVIRFGDSDVFIQMGALTIGSGKNQGQVLLDTGNGYQPFSTTTTVAANTWARIALKYDLTEASYGKVSCSIGGTDVGTLALTSAFVPAADRITFISTMRAKGALTYYDDFKLEILHSDK